MQTYTTQMDAARKGIVTPQMETVAKKEYRTVEEIRQLVAEGKVAIPANKHHECLNPEGIGSMLRTKINVNLGVSRDCKDYSIEMQKVMSAVNIHVPSSPLTIPFARRISPYSSSFSRLFKISPTCSSEYTWIVSRPQLCLLYTSRCV